jgi:type I restriction enzyme M protein
LPPAQHIFHSKKEETILDPACGTAGFLISSYKHILKHNSKGYREKDDHEAYDDKGVPIEMVTLDSPMHYKGDLLTPDERKRLAAALKGYDISPDMVRLSLVNLYLHGFTDPHIIEYDTLTSEERWNDYADIVLANPPFMSPKGGIKPHKRFSVQATRSEVLFVDYIAEHLTPTGRAAVIVPEGIIFQSGSAYKQLRKMLIENYLVAVISLPAGVFNPYSGVKTSIIVMDKRLSKKTDSILFAKIENDGFNLGAQRRPIDKNDLPAAARNLKAWLEGLRNESPFDLEGIPNLHLVEKARIAESGEWNLSGERYITRKSTSQHWEMVSLGDICKKITDGSHNPPEKRNVGELMLSSQNIFDNRLVLDTVRYISHEDFERENRRTEVSVGDVLLTIVGTIGRTLTVTADMPRFALQRSVAVLKPDTEKLKPDYLCRVIQSQQMQEVLAASGKGVAQKGIYLKDLQRITIPLPPIEVQKEIVAEIESHQKRIEELKREISEEEDKVKATINRVWGED